MKQLMIILKYMVKVVSIGVSNGLESL